MFARRTLLFVVPLLAALCLAGCKVNSINYFPPNPAPVRVLNLIPDAPPLNVTVAGNLTYTDVPFQGITGYQSFDNQITNFAVSVAGATTPLVELSANLSGSQPYALVISGLMSSPIVTLVVEFVNSGSSGNAQMSVFNGAINQGNVDVYLTPPGVDLNTVNPNYFAVTYNGNSRNLAFGGGLYQVRVTPNGSKSVLYDSGSRSFGGNTTTTLVLYSRGSGVLVNAVFLETQGAGAIVDGQGSRIKTVNAASQTGPVTQLLGAAPIATNVAYPTATAYNEVPPGTQTINFEAVATPGATIASVVGTLGASADQSIFVAGLPGALQAYVLNDLNVPPISGNTRVRFVNATTGVAPVNIQVNGTQQVAALAAPLASSYVEVANGTVTITYTDAGSGAAVFTLANVALSANQTMTVYLTGTPGDLAGLATQDN